MNCNIGKNTTIGKDSDLYNCVIGDNCRIGNFVYIEEGVIVGNNCKIKPFVFIPTGVLIGDNVFIGSNVCFTNDRYPRSVNRDGELKTAKDWTLTKTYIMKGASIGSGARIMCGICIGANAMIGMGAVVTKDVPDCAIVTGINNIKKVNE